MSAYSRLLMVALLGVVSGASMPTARGQNAAPQSAPAAEEKVGRAAAITTRLRSQVGEWIRTNIDAPGDRSLAADLGADMDRRLAAGENIRLVVDSAAARSTRGRMIATWAGQLHVFDLTDPQCRAGGAARGGVVGSASESTEASDAWEPAPFQLEGLRIDDADKITGEREITGSVMCRKGKVVPPGTIVVRTLYCNDQTSRVAFQFKDALPEDGKLRISISPADNQIKFGPSLILVDLLTTGFSETGVVASNAVGVVVDVRPDPEAALVAGLEMTKRIVEILASVKDAASATKAVKEYREAVTKNKALMNVLDNVGQVAPDVDAALTKKYEAQYTAAFTRLQEEYDRLVREPYAGQAFIDRLDKSVSEK